MTTQTLVTVLLGIIALGTLLGVLGVWFPEFWGSDVGKKLVWTFIVLAVGVTIACGVLKYTTNETPTQISNDSE